MPPKLSEQKLSQWKAKDCLALAKEYFAIASHLSEQKGMKRGAIDTAYNAAELCAKGMLYLKLPWIPSTHKGVVQKFCEFYIKDGPLSKDTGRSLSTGLLLRNKARYEKSAQIESHDVMHAINLAKDMIEILDKEK